MFHALPMTKNGGSEMQNYWLIVPGNEDVKSGKRKGGELQKIVKNFG